MDISTLVGNCVHHDLESVRVTTNLGGIYWMTKELESIESDMVDGGVKDIETKTRNSLLECLSNQLTDLFMEDIMYMTISSTVEKSEYLGVIDDVGYILDMVISSFCELKLKINNCFYGALVAETSAKVWLCLGDDGRCQEQHHHPEEALLLGTDSLHGSQDEQSTDKQSTLYGEYSDFHQIAQRIYHEIFSRARETFGPQAYITLLENLSCCLPENVDMGDFLKYSLGDRSHAARVLCENAVQAEVMDDSITIDGDMVFLKRQKNKDTKEKGICVSCLQADCGLDDFSPHSSTESIQISMNQEEHSRSLQTVPQFEHTSISTIGFSKRHCYKPLTLETQKSIDIIEF